MTILRAEEERASKVRQNHQGQGQESKILFCVVSGALHNSSEGDGDDDDDDDDGGGGNDDDDDDGVHGDTGTAQGSVGGALE